jgi:hypothetical protein
MQSADEAITELRVKIGKLGESKKLHEIKLAELTQEVEDNRKRRETDAIIETALYGAGASDSDAREGRRQTHSLTESGDRFPVSGLLYLHPIHL